MYPGLSDALVKLASDEHDEEGKLTNDLNLRIRMVDKRLKKFTLLRKEAAERLAGEGISTAPLHFGQVYPLTTEMIAPYRLEGKKRICVENNAGGQFAELLKRELGLAVDHRILKYNGECFTVEELCRSLKDLLS